LLLSILISFFTPAVSTIVFAITPSSLENGSNCAVPPILTPFASFILDLNFFNFSSSTKALHVIVLEPSYKSNAYNVFPLFNNRSSEFNISPSKHIFPLSTEISITFVNGSLIFGFLPYISGVISSGSSSGIGGASLSSGKGGSESDVGAFTFFISKSSALLLLFSSFFFSFSSLCSSIFLANSVNAVSSKLFVNSLYFCSSSAEIDSAKLILYFWPYIFSKVFSNTLFIPLAVKKSLPVICKLTFITLESI